MGDVAEVGQAVDEVLRGQRDEMWTERRRAIVAPMILFEGRNARRIIVYPLGIDG
jgi:hypothetical protein